MNCPYCKQRVERASIAVSGIADYAVEEDGILSLDNRSISVSPLLTGTNLQECPFCGEQFTVSVVNRAGQSAIRAVRRHGA